MREIEKLGVVALLGLLLANAGWAGDRLRLRLDRDVPAPVLEDVQTRVPQPIVSALADREIPIHIESVGETSSASLRLQILRQIALAYDRANIHSEEVFRKIQLCRTPRGRNLQDPDKSCGMYRELDRSESKDPFFQTLLGAVDIGGIFPTRRIGEEVSVRSPDAREFESVEEGFAINFSYFLADPEFKCRRPSMYRYFAAKWGPQPSHCDVNYVVPLSQELVSQSMLKMLRIDPSRLYQVHFLYATEGQALMSHWGHSMFRLVMCAPSRPAPGPDCLKDISYHLVVSFRANVQGLDIDNIKGLRGDYPSQLYLLSFLEVMREYGSDELRDLISVPLKLSESQKLDFLERSIQLFWEYRGRYMFVSNNCATEALNLLKSIIPDPEFQQFTYAVTPIGLYHSLVSAGLLDDSVLSDRERAVALSFYVPSDRDRLQRAFDAIRTREPDYLSSNEELDDYLASSTAEQRRQRFSRLTSRVSAKDRVTVSAAFFVLESYLLRTRQAELFKRVAQLVDFQAQADDAGRASEISALPPERVAEVNRKILRAYELQESFSPAAIASAGYGIALPADLRPHLEQELAMTQKEFFELMGSLQTDLENAFPVQLKELLESSANRKIFAKALSP